MRKLVVVLAAFGLLTAPLTSPAAPASHAPSAFPEKIALPDGFAPEGIEIARGNTFYVGSVQTGAIFTGDVRTGKGRILVQGAAPGTNGATGIEYDRGQLWVSGAGFGTASVYDSKTGVVAAHLPARNAARDVHQRRRGDEEGCLLHRLAATSDLPRHALEARKSRVTSARFR